MTKEKKIIIPVLMAVTVVASIFLTGEATARSPATSANPKGWYLIWNDEFDGASLDNAKWRAEDAALVKNKELQYYSPKNVYLHDGVLTLKSEKKQRGGRPYTSGLVETKGKFAFQYGRVEVRAKLPGTKGMWPAHWMMPESGAWPPEIDIMELVGSFPTKVHMTNHYGVFPNNRYDSAVFSGPDFTKSFYVFSIEWEPERIRWYVDGIQRYCVKKNVPEEPFYIILNTAVGGTMPGNPDPSTVFPQYHDIDYVRVYFKEVPGFYFLLVLADNGRVTAEPKKQSYAKGSKVKLTAAPNIGYKFGGWNGDTTAGNNPVVIKMDKHKKITANFIVDPDAPKLLSRGKQVVASSQESGALAALNAVDGDLNSRWSSEFSDPQWIYIDLGKVRTIKAVRLVWEIACAGKYEIQVSDDAKQWKTVYSTGKGAAGADEITDLNTAGRYVRIYGTERRTKFGYSLWEFEVFGQEMPM